MFVHVVIIFTENNLSFKSLRPQLLQIVILLSFQKISVRQFYQLICVYFLGICYFNNCHEQFNSKFSVFYNCRIIKLECNCLNWNKNKCQHLMNLKFCSLRYAMQMLSNISPQKYFIVFHPLLTINDKIKSIFVLNLKAFCQSINSAHANEQVAASSSCLLIHLGLISPKSFLGRQTNRFSGDK